MEDGQMTERERLIELIQNAVDGCAKHWAEVITDHLLANGVTVPPCKVGDTVYTIYSDEDISFIEEPTVKDVSTHRFWIESGYFDYSDIGKTVFLTREEAEAALKEEQS